MALPLLAFKPGLDPLSAGSVHLNSAALCQLLSAFRSCEPIYPLLFLGAVDSPAYRFLCQLLRETRPPEGSNFDIASLSPDCFAKIEEETAAVWPHPVYLGSHACMIIRMWDFDLSETEGETQRALVSLMAVAAYCFVSFDRSYRYRGLNGVQALYEQIRQRTGCEIAHFVVLDPAKIALSAPLSREKAAYEASPYATYTTFLPLPSDRDTAQFATSVFERFPPRRYVTSHEPRGILWIEGLCHDVEATVKAASLDMTFESFLDYLPIGNRREERAMQLERMRLALSHLREASVQPLFIAQGNSHYELDATLLESVRTNFDAAQPTVVLLLIGEPGLGKSTFCNYFLHYCVPTRTRRELFREGNTTGHTTKGSQFLSVPVPVPDAQLMIVDMEGLEGVETFQPPAAEQQRCLVDCVLAIVSVPCFVIRNETSSIQRVEAYIERFKRISDKTGARIERILLFFHDKDETSAAANTEMLKWITRLNATLFRGSPVVLLLNKPNFADPRKASMQRSFFSRVLAECVYPKRGESGAALTVTDLLTQVKFVAGYDYSDIDDIQLNDEEAQALRFLSKLKLAEFAQCAEGITSNGQTSLVRVLNERTQRFFAAFERLKEKPKVKARLRARLDEAACKMLGELTEAELDYQSISGSSDAELEGKITKRLNAIYDDTFWLPTFIAKCGELRTRLTRVGKHYPRLSSTIDTAIQSLERQMTKLELWYGLHYAATIGLTALSFGFGAAASTAKVATYATRYGYAAVSLLGSTVVKFIADLGGFRKNPSRQVFQLDGRKPVWDNELLARLKNGKSKCFLLAISTEDQTEALNSFVQLQTGLEGSAEQLLTSSSQAQMVAIRYPARNCDCVLLSLQFSSSADAETLVALACCAYRWASVACVFNERHNVHLCRILDTKLMAGRVPQAVLFTWPEEEFRMKEVARQAERTGLRARFNTGFGRKGPDADFVRSTLIESIAHSQVLSQAQFDTLILQLQYCAGR